jgi:hypothetical protein
MCGLVGVAGNLFTGDRKAFRNLLVLDTLRGDHSTGAATVSAGGKIEVVKGVGHPYLLFDAFKDVFDKDGTPKSQVSKVIMGHNRYATMGARTADNAHPFMHNGVVGAHNGTLDKHWIKNLDDHNKFEVDSEALIYNISKHGPDILKKVKGAYALTWWDEKQKKMFFIHNKERPLFYARSKDKDTFYWASEDWMIRIACGKAGIAVEDPQSFDVDHLYSIDVTECTTKFREVQLVKGDKIEGFTPPITTYNTTRGGQNNGANGTVGNGGTRNSGYNPFRPDVSTHLPVFEAPFKSATSGKEYAKVLEQYVGKSISFWSDMERKSVNGQFFLSCTPVNTEHDFEIRLYTKGRPIHEQIRKCRAPVVGTIKKVVFNRINGKAEVYLLVDYRSLYVPPPPSEIKEAILSARQNVVPLVRVGKRGDFRGYLGVPLSEEEWIEATAQGCAYCDAAVEPEEAKHLHWFGKTDYLCKSCSADPEKKSYAFPM